MSAAAEIARRLVADAAAATPGPPPRVVAPPPPPPPPRDPPEPGLARCIDGCGRTVRKRPDRSGRCIACRLAANKAAGKGDVPCPGGCGRTIRNHRRLCRACWDASPGKSASSVRPAKSTKSARHRRNIP